MAVTTLGQSAIASLGASDQVVLNSALSAYADEAYTNARKLTGTGIVGTNPQIDPNTETFIGQIRWAKPLNPTINVASLTSSTNGTVTTSTEDYLTYVKTVRTHGASKINMQDVVTRKDGLAKIAMDFGETRAQDEHNALLAVLKGVAASEVLRGVKTGGLGGQGWGTTDGANYGFYVDLAKALVSNAGYQPDNTTANNSYMGAARAEGFLEALGKAWKDYEPEYAYLIVSPQVMMSLRSANLVDEDRITEGNMNFNTIFGGKFRLIQTRESQALGTNYITKFNTGGGVDINAASTKTSFIVLPGAIAMASLAVPEPVEIYRDARAYMGGGTTQIWYRWGYVLAPAGYDWAGATTKFPANTDYSNIYEAGAVNNWVTVDTLTGANDCTGAWTRKASSALSLGILPVFHA